MAESLKRAPNDGDAKAYSSPNDRLKKSSRTGHLQTNPYAKGTKIDEQQDNPDDPMLPPTESNDDDNKLIGKALLTSFAQANVWFTISPDDASVLVIESLTTIPLPSTLLDKNHQPRWALIEAIPKIEPFLPEELEAKSKARQKVDQEITRHLVRLKLPETGFQSKLTVWLLENITSYKTKKILPVFSLANRLVRTPPSALPDFEEIDQSYILCKPSKGGRDR
jgi:hypothetical protein